MGGQERSGARSMSDLGQERHHRAMNHPQPSGHGVRQHLGEARKRIAGRTHSGDNWGRVKTCPPKSRAIDGLCALGASSFFEFGFGDVLLYGDEAIRDDRNGIYAALDQEFGKLRVIAWRLPA